MAQIAGLVRRFERRSRGGNARRRSACGSTTASASSAAAAAPSAGRRPERAEVGDHVGDLLVAELVLIRRHGGFLDENILAQIGLNEAAEVLLVVHKLDRESVLVEEAAVDHGPVLQRHAKGAVSRVDLGVGREEFGLELLRSAGDFAQIRAGAGAHALDAVAPLAVALAFENRLPARGVAD